MKLIACMECASSWGAVLDRPGDTETAARTAILAEMNRGWTGEWARDREADWPVTPPPMPEPTFRVEEVVYVSEASARWLSSNSLAETFVDACWQPVVDSDLPDWWVRARRTHTAVVVDRCCARATDPFREYARLVTSALARLLVAA